MCAMGIGGALGEVELTWPLHADEAAPRASRRSMASLANGPPNAEPHAAATNVPRHFPIAGGGPLQRRRRCPPSAILFDAAGRWTDFLLLILGSLVFSQGRAEGPHSVQRGHEK